MHSLIVTAKLNDVDPQAWLADVLVRIADIPQHRLGELLPWNWRGKSHAPARGVKADPLVGWIKFLAAPATALRPLNSTAT